MKDTFGRDVFFFFFHNTNQHISPAGIMAAYFIASRKTLTPWAEEPALASLPLQTIAQTQKNIYHQP
jgi:hypothetical protein